MFKPRALSTHISPLALLIVSGLALAQPAPALNPPGPIALKQGQSQEITVAGANLTGLASVSIADANGVTIELEKPDNSKPNERHIKISAAADAALGDREFRLIGPGGATGPLHLYVSDYPVIAEKEPNNTPAEAQEVSLPATILGRIDVPGDVDQYKFAAKKGQKLIFDLTAARTGSPMEGVITIHSADNREMKATLEHRGGDPILVFDVPEDGEYRLRTRDLEYRGGAEYAYRIVAGAIPHLEGVLPSSGEPGKIVEAQGIGYNLEGGEKISIDLRNSAPGRIEVRTKTSVGYSNSVPFEVTELPQAVESEPNDKPADANPISIPSEISGHIDKPGDEDFFKFHLAYKQVINFEVLAGRYGSPVAPLLELRNSKGDAIEKNDGTPDSDARIVRELDAGDYLVSVRDLTFAGGTGYWYRLKLEPARRVPQDFSVRFLPDAPRIHRGGNVALWCEVKRFNGFKGDVTITPEGLPSGVTAGPIVMSMDTSGWFTLAAAPDAALGTAPIGLRASATIGNVPVSHEAEPEVGGRVAKQAFLTVLEPAPFNVEAIAAMTPPRLTELNGQILALATKLSAPNPKMDEALAKWEKEAHDLPAWTVLSPATASSSKSTPLVKQPDGSFMASGNIPEQDEYTLTAKTDLKGITAVRLEVLADERLPGNGPGAAPNGNFVLTEFKMSVAKAGESAQPVKFKTASADFSQANFPIAAAIDGNPSTGWAVMPELGKTHTAVFELASPAGAEEGSELTFVLEHQSSFGQHIIGRFRISVTNADPAKLKSEDQIPPAVLAIVSTPADERTAEQKEQLAAYFRTIDPDTIAERNRLDALRSYAAPYAEIERLEAALKTETPELKAQQAAWEKSIAAGEAWTLLPVTRAKSESGVLLQNEKDGSIFADGPAVPSDVYKLAANTPLKGITAIRLEVIPDPRLPGNGPGRAQDGNFVLSRVQVRRTAKKGEDPQDIEFDSAKATVEQDKYGIAGALDDKDETGWAIAPAVGRPAEATFYPKEPIAGGPLSIVLEQKSKLANATLGRFRLWVTTNKQPDAAARVPENITLILKSKGRTKEQQQELAAYFRTIAPALEPVRQRLADLRAETPGIPLVIAKNRNGAIPVPIDRVGSFVGEVRVSLMGFATGRDKDNAPAPISDDLKLNPLNIPGQKLFGMLTFEPEKREQTGSRMVVLKAEATVGNETITEYSPAFLLTIEK